MSFREKLNSATPLICVFVYLLLGFKMDVWDKTLVIFLLIPLMPMLTGKKRFRMSISLLITVIYVCLGLIWGLWHPWWIIFLLIPILHIFMASNDDE